MKILHVTQGYYPSIGGTEWLIQRVSEELVRQYGDEVTVFATNCYNGEGFFNPKVRRFPIGERVINGVKVRRFPVLSRISRVLWKPQRIAYLYNLPFNQYLRAWAQGPLVPGLKKAIREFNSDVIGASSFPLIHMFVSLEAARETGRPCIFMGALHPDDDWGFSRKMIYKAIQQSTEYIAYTNYEAEYIISKGADPDRVHVIGLGVDPEPYQSHSQAEAKKHFELGEGPVVGYVGQVAGHKLELLLDAMPLVWEKIPEAILLIAGSRTAYHERFLNIISSWPEECRKKLKLIYNFDEQEKPWFYSAMDVFAYPSAWESFGIVFLEAWAARKPVVSCFRGAIPCVVDAGRDGLLVDFGNKEMLAEAIMILLNHPDMARAYGQAGQNKVMERYTWGSVAQRFRKVYEIGLRQLQHKSL